jgi:5'-nucleotidase / UDP-sugar diphosphatase
VNKKQNDKKTLRRREFLATSAATSAALCLTDTIFAAPGKRTFTILHTNDIHSNLIGVGPASEYTPASLKDDRTIGGIERLATFIAERRKEREAEGSVWFSEAT